MTADLFFEHVGTPALLLIVQIILIVLNKYTVQEEDRMGLFKCIIWLIPTIAIFPAQLACALLVTTQFTFAYVALGLLFLQIIMNVEIMVRIMRELETGKRTRKYRQ